MSIFDNFENFTKKVTETAKAAARKSGDIYEVTKLSMAIGLEEDRIDNVYTQIGKIAYDSFQKGEGSFDIFKEKFDIIKGYETNINDMKQKILEMKGLKVCPVCGAELDVDSSYCSKCGVKQEIPEPKVVEPEVRACPTCLETGPIDSNYCTKCGTKLE